jgi:hypothetical protein
MRDWTKTAEKQELPQVKKDMQKLRELVAEFDKLDVSQDENLEKHAKAFKDMLYRMETGRLQTLSETQRQYLKDLHERIVGEPEYENLFSRGLVPKGKPVETPAVLQKLPLKPPGKKQEWKE